VSTDPLKRTFLGCYISALRGCCALKFLHALQIDQALPAHTGTGRGSPKNFNRKNLKFGLKFSMLGIIIFQIIGSIPTELFSVDVTRVRSDKLGTIFEGLPPKI